MLDCAAVALALPSTMRKFRLFSPWTFLALFGLLLLTGIIIVRVAFGSYLKSEGFRRKIALAVGQLFKADATFTPLQIVDGTFYSDGFVARGNPDAFFSQLRADQIRAVFNWRGIFHRTWQIDELNVQQLDIHFPDRSAPESSALKSESPPVQGNAGWKVDLRRANVAQSSWHWGANDQTSGRITGSAFTLTPSGNSWLIDANSGQLFQNGWPELSIESAKLRYTRSSLFVTESVLRTGIGRVLVSGEVRFHEAVDLRTQFDDLAVAPLLPPDWRVRLTGNGSGTANIHAPLTEGPIHIDGNMHLTEGQIEALPLLNQIATFTRTERFRRMALSQASLSFTRDGNLLTAKDVILESEGLMRIEGACTVVNDQIDGVFQIGVTAAALQWLPGSQARVFTIAHDGYFWTPLRLTGPVAHPTEDLTPRLIAAAAGEILQNSEDALRDTAKSILDLIPY
jgi:hypothetical protein